MKKKIFEQLKKCIMLKMNSIGKVKTHTHVRVLIRGLHFDVNLKIAMIVFVLI